MYGNLKKKLSGTRKRNIETKLLCSPSIRI